MSARKVCALALVLALLAGAVPARAETAEVLWLPEGVRFATELGYVYVPELDWLSVSLDEYGFVPALYDVGAGKMVEEFDDIGPFSEGLAVVSKNGKDGYIDRTGQVVISLVWDIARDFHSGVAVAILERPYDPPYEEYVYLDYYLIDPTGAIVAHLGPEYGNVSDFYGDVAQVWDPDTDLVWYIDTQGRVVAPPEDTSVFDHNYDYDQIGLTVEWQGEKCGLVDRAGNVVIPCQYDYASWINEGSDFQPGRYWYVRQGDRFGLVLDPTWEMSASKNETRSSVSFNGLRDLTFALALTLTHILGFQIG